MIRVAIADDHPIVRGGIRRVVELEPDMTVVAEADTADALLAALSQEAADVLLLDVSMPGPGVVDVLRQCAERFPTLRTLVLSVYPEEQYGVRVLRAGAAGYVTKDQSPELLARAIRHVHGGHAFLSSTLADRLAAGLKRGYRAAAHELLSEREHAVLRGLGAGRSVTATAAALGLSPKTVSTYRTRLLEKLGLATNADLVRYVRDHGLAD